MPGINNINNVNNVDSKRVQSKLSFQVGEVFQAKVVEVANQGNEVVLKTMDGWQFTANTKIPLENLPKGLVKFKVSGYEDGKLQIVVVPEESDGANTSEKSIQTILKQQNLSSNKGDLEMLKSMVSHGIPLTKENISAVKTIIDFKEKISANIGEEDAFIGKYLQSKGIDINSEQGKNINTLLKGFFNELKKVSVEDLVTLKENGIDITEDNLKSFNKVFKEDIGLYKEITQNMNKEVLTDKNVVYSSGNNENTLDKQSKENLPAFKEIIKDILKGNDLTKSTEFHENNAPAENMNNEITQKTDLIKNGIAQKTDLIKAVIKGMNDEDLSLTKNSLVFGEKPPLNNSTKEPQNYIKTDNAVSKDTQELKIAQTILENDIPVTKENISNVKAIIDLKEEILTQPKNETETIKLYLNSKNISEDSDKGKALNNSIKEFFDTIKKEPVKEVLARLQVNSQVEIEGTDVKTFDKQFKEDFPVFKEIIKETLKGNGLIKNTEFAENTQFTKNNGLHENVKNETLQKADVIKRSNDVDLSTVKSNSLFSEKAPLNNINTETQSYIKTGESVSKETQEVKIIQTILENDIPVTKENVSNVKAIIDLKEEILAQPKNETEIIKLYLNSKNISEDSDKGVKALTTSIKEFFDVIKKEPVKEVLAKLQVNLEIKTEGTDVKTLDKQFKEDFPAFKEIIKDILKGNELPKNMEINKGNGIAENIKSEIAQKTDFMKDIIKSMKDGDWSLIKSSINDIKVFNTVSNQYYYMDVPVNVDQRQYECKLLVKDDRNKGKKIDSKNVKMFVSVKTINMGKVDVYIKVSDRNVNIDLKCNDNFIKVFQNENSKLVSTLQDMNYNVKLNIEKRASEANIVTTREFFQDNAIGSINVMV